MTNEDDINLEEQPAEVLNRKEEQQIEVKKPTELNAKLTFKNEQTISNGTVERAESISSSITTDVSITGGESTPKIIRNADGSLCVKTVVTGETVTTTRNSTKGLTLDDLHTVYAQNGNSAAAAYNHLTTYIQENKDDPEAIQNTVSMLLGDLGDAYDNTRQHKQVGADQIDVLDKILSTDRGEEVPALICGTIHDFLAQTLEDCGIKACLVTGGNMPDGAPHATLLYDRGDGKYVWNNYSKSMVIDAPSIKDAAREVYKRSGSLESSGMIAFQDKDNASYQEFAFKEEAAFGNDIDKRAYDSSSPFDSTVAQRPSIDANVQVSSVGNISANAGGTLAYGNDKVSKETSLDLEYKCNNETSMFLESQSIGAKVEHKVENSSGLYYSTKGVVSYTEGKTGGMEYDVIGGGTTLSCGGATADMPETITKESSVNNYITAMFHGEFGKKTTLVSNENLELTNAGQASLHAFGTLGLGDIHKAASGDARFTVEDGFGLKNNISNVTLNNTLSGGIVTDITNTCDGVIPAVGMKLNASTSINYNPNENLQIKANAKAYSVFTKSSTDYGLSAGAGAQYKPAGSNVLLFGSTNVTVEQQDLSIGLFNQKTENNLTMSTTLGAQLNKNTTVYAGYTYHKDNLNSTRNYNQVEIGAKFNF